jgi:hypothetical protein
MARIALKRISRDKLKQIKNTKVIRSFAALLADDQERCLEEIASEMMDELKKDQIVEFMHFVGLRVWSRFDDVIMVAI